MLILFFSCCRFIASLLLCLGVQGVERCFRRVSTDCFFSASFAGVRTSQDDRVLLRGTWYGRDIEFVISIVQDAYRRVACVVMIREDVKLSKMLLLLLHAYRGHDILNALEHSTPRKISSMQISYP